MTASAPLRVLLGVTGGIAAYKSAELVRRLRDAGAEVRVVMTPAACAFIAPSHAAAGRRRRRQLARRRHEPPAASAIVRARAGHAGAW